MSQLKWQAAEAKFNHREAKSLPLENHSSVAHLAKRTTTEGGVEKGMKREQKSTGQEEERAFTVSKKKAAISEPPSLHLRPNSTPASAHILAL